MTNAGSGSPLHTPSTARSARANERTAFDRSVDQDQCPFRRRPVDVLGRLAQRSAPMTGLILAPRPVHASGIQVEVGVLVGMHADDPQNAGEQHNRRNRGTQPGGRQRPQDDLQSQPGDYKQRRQHEQQLADVAIDAEAQAEQAEERRDEPETKNQGLVPRQTLPPQAPEQDGDTDQNQWQHRLGQLDPCQRREEMPRERIGRDHCAAVQHVVRREGGRQLQRPQQVSQWVGPQVGPGQIGHPRGGQPQRKQRGPRLAPQPQHPEQADQRAGKGADRTDRYGEAQQCTDNSRRKPHGMSRGQTTRG